MRSWMFTLSLAVALGAGCDDAPTSGGGDEREDGPCSLIGDWACSGDYNDHISIWEDADAFWLDFSICDDPMELAGDPGDGLVIVTSSCDLQSMEVKGIDGELLLEGCDSLDFDSEYYITVGWDRQDYDTHLECRRS